MADEEVLMPAVEVLNATLSKPPSTTEGLALAYGCLLFMALGPIILGAFRSVKHHKEQKERLEDFGEKPDTMTTKDAAMFPLIASGALFGIYIFFKLFSKEYINLLLTGYFFILGVLAMTHLLSPSFTKILTGLVPLREYHLQLIETKSGDKKESLIDQKFTSHDLVTMALSSVIGVWYLLKKHWIANNLFGLAFAVNGVELLHLNSVLTGCILLSGLFVYDIFWVFGTDVMVTVAKSFEAPIKLIFPQDLIENGLSAGNFAMLGLGDIVIPGIFIALLLRFDNSLSRGSNTYFNATFIAYVSGLLTCIFVMHVFKHAQPALLYLVPACLGTPLLLAAVKGDLKVLFQYEDHPSDESKEVLKKTDEVSKKTE